jgi:predicted enzyme related to lactoylglutathione lyase
MQPTHVLTGVVVGDMDRAVRWYTEFLGRSADTVPMPSCHEWKLGADVTLQVRQDREVPPGQGSFALVVDDLDAAVAAAPSEFTEVTEVPGFVRTATTSDPDGNRITLVESLAS